MLKYEIVVLICRFRFRLYMKLDSFILNRFGILENWISCRVQLCLVLFPIQALVLILYQPRELPSLLCLIGNKYYIIYNECCMYFTLTLNMLCFNRMVLFHWCIFLLGDFTFVRLGLKIGMWRTISGHETKRMSILKISFCLRDNIFYARRKYYLSTR